MVRRLLRGLLVASALLATVGAWLWYHLGPPAIAIPPPGGYSIEDVTVVSPGRGREPHRTLRIQGGRIVAVVPSDAARSDAARPYAGAFALPGLIDMHVHHPPATPLGDVELVGLLFLAHGVTTVRDTGSVDGSIFTTRRRIRAGEIAGPRIFACGPLIDGDPPFWPGSRVARDAGEGRAAVRAVAALGADCVKVYDRVSPEALAAIHEEAQLVGLRVIGHVPDQVQFVEAKLADVQHLTGVMERGKGLTLARVRMVVTTSAALGIAHTPTLVVYDRVGKLSDYARERDDAAARLMPRYYREVLWNPRNDQRFSSLDAARWAELEDALEPAIEMVRRLREAGVEIHVGTDAMNPFVVPGRSMHEEMRLLLRAGFTPEEVWVAATRKSGEFLGEPGLGTIAPGAPADLVLYRADPTRDLAALDTLEAVVAAGRLYPRAALDGALARWQAHFDDPIFDRAAVLVTQLFAPSVSR